ncbi:uncharacterized protein [Oscarella lobularis]|uniref:uncharacterized protein n=1 Tax=Oscarella lobularis TaxID=121494 RepID=UPI0033136430
MRSWLYSLALVVTFAAVAAKMPPFSWDTVPVYNFLCNKSGPFNDAAVQIIARFPIIAIDQGQGEDVSDCCTEDKILAVAKQIKAVNDSVYIIFYYNSMLDWNGYRLHEKLLKHPEFWLRNASGEPVRIPGDHSFKQPKEGMLVFDLSTQAGRDFWASDCINATKSEYIDGCFADRAGEDTFQKNTLSPETAKAYASGHVKVLQDLQKSLGDNVLMANNDLVPGVGSTMIEGFRSDEKSILRLQEAVAQNKLVEVHAGYSDSCRNITDTLAAFLIGAGEYSYYACSQVWFVDETHKNWLTWRPEYDKPLGKPTGPATKSGDVYTRQFASGTVAMFNAKTNKGNIKWAK